MKDEEKQYRNENILKEMYEKKEGPYNKQDKKITKTYQEKTNQKEQTSNQARYM